MRPRGIVSAGGLAAILLLPVAAAAEATSEVAAAAEAEAPRAEAPRHDAEEIRLAARRAGWKNQLVAQAVSADTVRSAARAVATATPPARRETAGKPATPPPASPAPVVVAPPAPAPAPPPAPVVAPAAPAPSDGFLGAGGKLLIGSLVLTALLFGATRVVRKLPIARFLPSATEGAIRITARVHLGARESLCLVEVQGTSLLVAITGQTMQTLHVWPDAAPAPRTAAAAGLRAEASSFTPRPPAPAAPVVPGQLRNLQSWLASRR